MKKDRKHLYQKLPSYTPKEQVWHKISDKLNKVHYKPYRYYFDDKLPKYNAPEKVWTKIENELNIQKTKKSIFTVFKIAAALIATIGITFIIKMHISNQSHEYLISYDIAYAAPQEEANIQELYSTDMGIKELLDAKCRQYPSICNSTDFIELDNLLNELNKEKDFLKQEYEKFNDHEIKINLLRIENERVKIEKYIINLFNNKTK